MKIRKTVLAAVGLAVAGMLTAAVPASAAPAPHSPRTGLGDDVYLFHPIIQSVLQTPPLETLIRFRMEALVAHMPKTFHMTVHLLWWRSAKARHKPRGAWVEIHPTVTYGISALPGVGQHHYLKPPADWTCEQGRFYIKVHAFGIMHNGQPSSVTAYFPWAGFTKKNLDEGNVHKPPSLKQAWKTECQGHDTLIG